MKKGPSDAMYAFDRNEIGLGTCAGIGLGLVGQAQEIVDAGFIKGRKTDENIGGEVSPAIFVMGIAHLGTVKVFGQDALRILALLAETTDTGIHIGTPFRINL